MLFSYEFTFYGLTTAEAAPGCVGGGSGLKNAESWQRGLEDLEVQEAALRADWIDPEIMEHVLAALMPANALAVRTSMATGLRIGDVLEITTDEVRRGRWTVHEGKTGKGRRVRLPARLRDAILSQAGHVYAFEGRTDGRRHRTRQAVYKDIRRAAEAFRLREHISPHTARKMYAVESLKKYGDLRKVQQLLNHESEAVTMIYALADQLTARKMGRH